MATKMKYGTARTAAIAVLCATLALVALLASSVRAYADPPTFQTIPVSFSGTSPFFSSVCGFNVTRNINGTVREAFHYNNQGQLIKEIDQVHLNDTITAGGATLTINRSGPQTSNFNDDGTITVWQRGPDMLIIIPGSGPVLGHAGLQVVTIYPDGTVQVDAENGLDVFDPRTLCSALAP
jgi:hypothetical protein